MKLRPRNQIHVGQTSQGRTLSVYLTNAGTGDNVGILDVRYIPPVGYLSVRISTPVILHFLLLLFSMRNE